MATIERVFCALALGQSSARSTDILRFFYSKAADRAIGTRIEADYKTTPARFLDLAEKVTRRMIATDFDYVPGVSVAARARSIQAAALDEVRQNEPGANELLNERMVVQGLYDWTRTHITYNAWIAKLKNDREVRKHYWKAEELFSFQRPTAVCAGIADVMTKMAVRLQVDATMVDGMTRRQFETSGLPTDSSRVIHSWVLVRQSDGFVFPCDPTRGGIGLEQARVLQGKAPQGIAMPVVPLDWTMYFAVYYPTQALGRQVPQNLRLLRLTYDEWLRAAVAPLRRTRMGLAGGTWSASRAVDYQPSERQR